MTAAARTRPLALDGHSFEAAAAQTPERVSAVAEQIIDIYRVCGNLADHELVRIYQERAENLGIQPASPQSIRSRRAELEHRGVVAKTTITGTSEYGKPCSVYALADQDEVTLW